MLYPFRKLWKSTVLQLHTGTEGINFLYTGIFIWFFTCENLGMGMHLNCMDASSSKIVDYLDC